jgi:oligosaccharide repeat unit polymerase
VRITTGFNSILAIFLAFFFIYTFSVPLSILLGFDYNFFDLTEYYMQDYLLQAYLCYMGVAVGVLMFQHTIPASSTVEDRRWQLDLNPRLLINLGLLLGMISSLMEVINVIRAGGVASLYAGKAVYQESMGNVEFTLPSRYLCDLAAAIWGIGIAQRQKVRVIDFLLFIGSISLLLAICLIAGQRGPMLGWLMILFVSITYFRNIKKVGVKIGVGVVVVYVVMSMIFNYRSLISRYMSTGDLSASKIYNNSDRLSRNFNPANNEFGAAFGNFNVYIKATHNRSADLYWGTTYLQGFLIVIPGFLYPGEKPKQIAYEFRDKYFSVMAERSRISGTGFSSLLEAFMNFGYFGSFLFFILVGRVFVYLESRRMRRDTTTFFILVYLTLLPIAQSFHRGAFGGAVSEFIYKILFFMVMLFLVGKLSLLGKRGKLRHIYNT